MIEPLALIAALEARGVDRWFGVPDSVLRGLGDALMSERPERTLVAANEGAAVGLAAGHWLATGRESAVWLQNAGLGNAVNPLLSLVHGEVYDLPLWLVLGWRGAPGQPDEPQHRPQGAAQAAMLAQLGIPWAELPEDAAALPRVLAGLAGQGARKALVVRPGRLGTLPSGATPRRGPNRADAIAAVLAGLDPEDVVVATTGMTGRELWQLRAPEARDRDLLIVGSMGHASAVALGIALGQPGRRVVLLDGDGALLMHMGTLTTIGRSKPKNLLHVVLNNGVHDSVGGVPTGALELDLPAIALGAGYASAARVERLERLPLWTGGAPRLLELRITPGGAANLPRPDEPLADLGRAFARRLRG